MVISLKKILITGARSGIGNAVVEKLLTKDYYLYVTVKTEKENVARVSLWSDHPALSR